MKMKKLVAIGMATTMMCATMLTTGCSGTASASEGEQVIFYSNADDEAVTAMTNALDANGYEGQYIFQSIGTSELGGKLLAEGTEIEADVVTMSSYYLDSAQELNKMFQPLTFEADSMESTPDFYRPITFQEGAIIVNTELMEEYELAMPASLKDLAKPEYEGYISVTDVASSSTAWLLIQALIDAYGNGEAKEVLTAIYANAGVHIESSGSAPLKKVRAGEVAIGFGLRHQAVADKEEGLPIDYVDPTEGNFAITESIALIDKGDQTNQLAMEMIECIILNARKELLETYPNPIYNGEEADPENQSTYPRVFSKTLTVDLLKEHEALSEECK